MMDPFTIAVISVVSFVSSWFGTLAGGGGLIVIPVMLSFGIPVPFALGTRRFSTISTTAAGMIAFHKWKKVDYRFSTTLVVYSLIGSVAGYLIVDSVNETLLKKTIGVVILLLAFFLMFENTAGIKEAKGKLYLYRHIIGPPVSALSGVFSVIIGGGGGLILSYLIIIVYGQTILESSGNRRLTILVSNILATALFIMGGYVNYPLAFAMLFANALGGWFGARFYLKKGDEKVRIFFFSIVMLLGIKILFF